ncbi:MAG: ATP-binding protein [Thiotrichaceae bacterium]|nr:ATP-binding protein [Thiotrichaceae bacterium]
MVEIYEKLGLFYIGKDVDKSTLAPSDALTLLKNKNFTTHAAIIGMTGSGKTGLGIGLIEEAAIDNIPAIVIDPKGDMGNLCLTDSTFLGKNFEPWVKDEAQSKEQNVSEYATKIAAMWKSGIEDHHQDSERVAKFASVKKTIYTPGSSSGVSLNILGSLESPPQQILDDTDSFSSYLKTTVSSLLALISVEADPLESKEYILIAQIIHRAWRSGQPLSIETLIGQIISPNFDKIGVLPLNAFYPQAERFKLSTKFNSILASPTFSAWLEGDSLDIQKLLYDEQGKAKIAIFSIAHLGDDERMFFVTVLLNKYIAWMRRQSGTSALKTILYMDEIYGFFPPTKNPPSKEPMLLLLKQARAFGVGIILSTQNPVDLDYKGLSNIGTWFIGRLQTTQDIDRVIDGLGGKVDSSYSKKEIKNLLANLKKRTFFLKSAHLDDIRLFSTRWVMSYLKGPLKCAEISQLMSDTKEQKESNTSITTTIDSEFKSYTGLDNSTPQYYELDLTEQHQYHPHLMARYNLHFFNQTRGIDEQEHHCLTIGIHPLDNHLSWKDAENNTLDNMDNGECFSDLPCQAPSAAQYATSPSMISHDKQLSKTKKDLQNWLYHNHRLKLFRCTKPKLESRPYESLADFKVRLNDLLNDKKELAIEALQERYTRKEKVLLDRLARAEQRVAKEKSDTTGSMLRTGVSILGALFGRSSISTAVRSGSRILKERGDVGRAQERIEAITIDIETLEDELNDKIDQLAETYDIDNMTLEDFAIKLRRTDIEIAEMAIVWKC